MADNKPGLLLMCHGDFPGNFFTDPRNRKLYEDCLAAMGHIHEGDHDRSRNDDLTMLSHSMASSLAGRMSLKGIEMSYLGSGRRGIGHAIANAAAKSPRTIVCAGAAGLTIPGHGTLEHLPGELRRVLQDSPALDIKYTGPWLDADMAAGIVQLSIEDALGGSTLAMDPPCDPVRSEDLSVVLVSAPGRIKIYDDMTAEFFRNAAMLSNRSARWHDAGIVSEASDFMENVTVKLRAMGFTAVEAGFIDFAAPDIFDAAMRLIGQGAGHIVATSVPALLHRHPLSIINPDEAVRWLRVMIPYACIRYLRPEPDFVARMLSGHMVSKLLDTGHNGARIL